MFGVLRAKKGEAQCVLDALHRSLAIIEFDTAGYVLSANANFLNMMGYSLDEIRGKSHRIFVDPAYADSHEYYNFWSKLKSGAPIVNEFKRIGRNGNAVWIQASYNPIFDANKNIVKIVQFAIDITNRALATENISYNISKLMSNLSRTLASLRLIYAVISEEAQSSQGQAGDLSQIDAVIDQVEVTAAAYGLKSETDTIANLIARFETGDGGAGPLHASAARISESTVVRLGPSRATSMRDPDNQRARGGGPAATLAFPSRKDRS